MLFILNRPEHFFYKKKRKSRRTGILYIHSHRWQYYWPHFFTAVWFENELVYRTDISGRILADFQTTTFLSLILCPFTTLHCTVQKVYIGFIRAFNIIKSDLKALIGSPRVLYLSILYTKSRKIVPLRSSLANESIPNFWQNTLTKIERSPPSQEGEKLIGHYYSRWEEKADRTSL